MHTSVSQQLPQIVVALSDAGERHMLCARLQRAGLTAEEAPPGVQLQTWCTDRRPELVVVDAVRAPTFRTEETADSLPIPGYLVVVDEKDVDKALLTGAVEWTTRPLQPNAFVRRVKHALRNQRQMREREELRASVARMEQCARSGCWEYTPKTAELACSAGAFAVFGAPADSRRVQHVSAMLDLVHPGDAERFKQWLEALSNGGATTATIEHRIVLPNSGERSVRQLGERVEADATGPRRVLGVIADLTGCSTAPLAPAAPAAPVARTTPAVQTHFVQDALKALPDRAQFLGVLAQAIGCARHPREQLALVYVRMDIPAAGEDGNGADDHERATNMLLGRFKDCLRERDAIGHLGLKVRDLQLARMRSDEFAILLPALANAQDAYKVAKRLQAALSEPLELDGAQLHIASSLGLACHPVDGPTAETLLAAGESAMRRARQMEANSIQFHTAAMNASAFQQLTLETSLRRAIEREELLVYYQPKVEIATCRIVGFEALVRWNHPELGMVAPAQFIPIAEETGLIVPLGEYVLRAACTQNVRWQKQGLTPGRMAVNVSTVQFRDPRLEDTIATVLRETGLAPQSLELELTESVLLQSAEATVATLLSLKQMGIHLSIDDFGTGYSSLSYLKRFPIDALKIDQSFIREMLTNPDDASITTSILLMGKSLKLRVVAEGVESRSQLAFLKVLECDEAQGYLFSRPVPAQEAGELLVRGVEANVTG